MDGTQVSRRLFVGLSRVMAPLIRRGIFPSTRIGGSLCVLRTTGRRSGRPREAALDYAWSPDGGIWLMAGWGAATQWYQNLVADPVVAVTIDGRHRRGAAEVLHDPAQRTVAIRAVLLASGLPGRTAGVNPVTASDAQLAEVFAGFPVVHVRLE